MTNMEMVAEALGVKLNDTFYIVGNTGSYSG